MLKQFAFILLLLGSLNYAITACANLTSNSSLTANIVATGYTCFNITAANVYLNCSGYNVTMGNASTDIAVSVKNSSAIIENCNFQNVSQAVNFNSGGNNGLVTNTTANSTRAATVIRILAGATNDTVNNSKIYGAAPIEIDTSNNTVSNSTLYTTVGTSGTGNLLIESPTSLPTAYNLIVNNTFLTSIAGENFVVFNGSSAPFPIANNTFYDNNFTNTSGYYIIYGVSITGTNQFNSSTEGNAYFNVMNGSVAVNGTTKSTGYPNLYIGSQGAGFPYNNSTSNGKVSSGIVDYYPLTPTKTTSTPFITAISVIPASSSQLASISCNITVTDALALTTNIAGYWLKNGANQTSLAFTYNSLANNTMTTISTLTPDKFSVGQNWSCAAIAFNGNLYSALNYSANNTIGALPCGTLNNANTNYTMNQTANISGSACFSITAANVSLNCAGNSIIGNNTPNTYGIYTTQFNTTVSNCTIQNFTLAAFLNGATNNTFINNTFIPDGSNSNSLVLLNSTQNSTFYWNNFTNTSGYYVNDTGVVMPAASISQMFSPYQGASVVTNSGGTASWTSPGNIISQDGVTTNVTITDAPTNSRFIAALYNISSIAIPNNATITGIVASILVKTNQSSTGVTDNNVNLFVNNASTGTSRGNGCSVSNSFVTCTYGTSTDLWGTTALTPQNVTSGKFGWGWTAQTQNDLSIKVLADYMNITVYFANSSGSYSTGNNHYNSSIPEGNIYYNVGSSNLTGSTPSTAFPSYDVATGGSSYPYNNSTSAGKFICPFAGCADYAPLFIPSAATCAIPANNTLWHQDFSQNCSYSNINWAGNWSEENTGQGEYFYNCTLNVSSRTRPNGTVGTVYLLNYTYLQIK